MIIKFGQTAIKFGAILILTLEKSVFFDAFSDYVELIDLKLLTSWHWTTEATLSWDKIIS